MFNNVAVEYFFAVAYLFAGGYIIRVVNVLKSQMQSELIFLTNI